MKNSLRINNNNIIPGSTVNPPKHEVCQSTRHTTSIGQLESVVPLDSCIITHANCTHNEVLALRNRHQTVNYLFDAAANPEDAQTVLSMQKSLYKYTSQTVAPEVDFATWMYNYPSPTLELIEPISKQSVINHYTGGKRNEYQAAYDKYLVEGVDTTHFAKVSMFLKDDKYQMEDNKYEIKVPRCIQFRPKLFCLMYGQYIKPLEKTLYALRDEYNTLIMAKGRNSHQRAADLLEKSRLFAKPYIYQLDHSKWDAHNTWAHLKVKHNFYNSYLQSETFKWLQRKTYVNKGKTKSGVKYKTIGTVMSGEMDTALGNCVGNIAIISDVFYEAGAKFSIYVDGDDSVIFCDREIPMDQLRKMFKARGMKTTGDVVRDFEDIDFCQCKPITDGTSWRMVRDPLRTLFRMAWITKQRDKTYIQRIIKSNGMCELALNNGVPIIQAAALCYIKCGSGKYASVDREFMAKNEYYNHLRAKPYPITDAARLSMQRAFGISPERQIELEESFKSLTQPLEAVHTYYKYLDMLPGQLPSITAYSPCDAYYRLYPDEDPGQRFWDKTDYDTSGSAMNIPFGIFDSHPKRTIRAAPIDGKFVNSEKTASIKLVQQQKTKYTSVVSKLSS